MSYLQSLLNRQVALLEKTIWICGMAENAHKAWLEAKNELDRYYKSKPFDPIRLFATERKLEARITTARNVFDRVMGFHSKTMMDMLDVNVKLNVEKTVEKFKRPTYEIVTIN